MPAKVLPQLDPETVNEILSYAFGMKLSPIYYRFEVIPADAKDDLAFWLKTKVDFEGPPIQGIVDEIGADGVIERPVILDVLNDLAVEGRHRLAAALQYDLDVPAVLIHDTPGRGWRKLSTTRTLGDDPGCAPRILGRYHVDDVIAHWRSLYRTGRHQEEPKHVVGWAERGSAWVLASLPIDVLDFQTTAESGEARVALAREYARWATPFPPGVALYGRRAAARRAGKAYVADGNHRTLAAALRGDCAVQMFMQKDEYALLVADAEYRRG